MGNSDRWGRSAQAVGHDRGRRRQEKMLGSGRFSTDQAGYAAMRTYAQDVAAPGLGGRGRQRRRAAVGAAAAGGRRAGRRRAGQAGGPGAAVSTPGTAARPTPIDAHAVAMAAVRTPDLRVLASDEELEALRRWSTTATSCPRRRVQTVNRLHRLLAELIPGGAPKNLTAPQAKTLLAGVRPRDPGRQDPRRMAAEELADLVRVDTKLKALNRELKAAVLARGSHLMDLYGVGPVGGRTDPGRRRRRRPVPRPQPLRVLDRHRTPGRLVRRAHPPPAVPRREPADQPRAAHRRDHPDPPRQRRPALLPAQARRRPRPARKPCAA